MMQMIQQHCPHPTEEGLVPTGVKSFKNAATKQWPKFELTCVLYCFMMFTGIQGTTVDHMGPGTTDNREN